MKKLLLSLVAIVASMSLSAQTTIEVNFSSFGFENAEQLSTVEVDGVSLTFTKGTGTAPAWYNTGTAARLYGGNTLTITSTVGNILAADFTVGSSNKFNNNCTADDGTLDIETQSWSGNTETFTITNGNSSGHVRISKIVLTISNGEVTIVNKPKASVPSGTYYEAQTVELTCATEGASIQYQIDGEGFEPYTEPIVITNSCALEAKAVKDGKESDVATYNYVIAKVNTVTVEEALAIIEGLDDKAVTTDMYIVSGVVESIKQNFGTSFGTAEFTLEGGLVAYRLNYLDNQPEKNEEKLHIGDEVVVKGQLQKYGTTPEIVKGYVVEHKVSALAVEKAKASVASGTYYEAQTVELTCETEGAVIMYQIDENDYQQYSAPLTVAESCTLNVYAQKGEAQSEVVTYAYVIKSLPTNASLLANGSFEEWEKDENDAPTYATNWKTASTAASAKVSQSTDARTGSYAALCTATSSNTRLSYKETSVKADTYYLVFYAKNAEAGNDATICPGYTDIDENGKANSNYTYGNIITTTDEWTRYVFEFTLNEDATICPLVRINGKSAPVLFDDFSLIPENGNTTGIDTVAGNASSSDIYSLTGVKLQRPAKGLNIIGGRKVMVK